MNTVKFEELNH